MKRALLPLLLAACLLKPATADALTHSWRWRTLHAAERLCSQERPTACIRYAALKYRQPYAVALRVARCESTLRPWINGHHEGMWQFLWSTWRTTPYRSRSPYSARWSSLGAMWMWAQKPSRRSEWACQ